MPLLRLGTYQFAVTSAAYDSLTRSSKYRWSGQARLQKKERLQFLGESAESINLKGTIYAQFSGVDQINKMRQMAALGQPQELIGARGNTADILGKWVIENIGETASYFTGSGAPRKQEFTIAIKEYSE